MPAAPGGATADSAAAEEEEEAEEDGWAAGEAARMGDIGRYREIIGRYR